MFKRRALFGAPLLFAARGAAAAFRPLANDYTTVFESPQPESVYAGSPGLVCLPDGRLVASNDQFGPGVAKLPGMRRGKWLWSGRVHTSDDGGRTWIQRAETPVHHGRPFLAGKYVYLLGHQGDLIVMRSADGGRSWSEPVALTEGQQWHQAPCNVLYHRGKIYLVMERVTDTKFPGWKVPVLAPVVMVARVDDNLLDRRAWTFSEEYSFQDAIRQHGAPRLIGAPFFKPGFTAPDHKADRRTMAPLGWLETNIVRFEDPDHVWFDPEGRTFHLWMRSHTGTSNLACIAKAVESRDGKRISVILESAPSGEPMLYMPCPGGHMKFHILFDEKTRLFWLLSSQSTDSMTKPEKLPANRYNLPNNERHRLALHFSKNCVDWCFAGLVADSGNPGQGRHYASMAIYGEDLYVLSRSGDGRARDSHNGNLITFHTVRNFRSLVY